MYVGEGIDRVDGPAKVTGGAKYAAEFGMAGVVHGVLVQSTVAAGTLAGLDVAAAAAMPGVLGILTPQDMPRLALDKASPQTVLYPLLQDMAVQYNGQHLAVVVADTLERASEAAVAVRARYDEADAVTTMVQAMDHAYVPKKFRDGKRPPDSTRGKPDEAFAAAPVKVEQTYTTPIEHHNPMEPHATLAQWDGGKLTVWTATQGISGVKKTLAALFALEPDDVVVIDPYVGGGFGSKGNCWPPVVLAAAAARKVGRPVRLVVTREQMYYSNGYRPRTSQTVRLGAQADGTLVALRHDAVSQNAMDAVGEFDEPAALISEISYSCPNVAITHRLVAVNQGLPTYMRAPGEAPGSFALEVAMDEMAVALGMDPIALRLKNYAERDEHEDKPFASKALRACYAQGAAAFGWDRRSAAPRSMRDGAMLVGQGMAGCTYPTNRNPSQASARLDADGTAVVRAGTQDLGTGTYTVMTQVAADELGLPLGKVRAELGDSRLPAAPVSGGSTTVASVLPAVQAACRAVRTQLFGMALAAKGTAWAGVAPEQLALKDGVVSGPAGSVTVAEVLGGRQRPFVEAESGAKPDEAYEAHSRHAFGAQFAEVRVDPDFGTIRVSRLVGAFDCGRVINAKTARSQLYGGMVFGLGMALLEESVVDAASGRYTNANLSEYLLPVNADVREIVPIIVDSVDPVTNELGAKGVGELPMVGVAAAIGNAVFHATGVRVRHLPIRLDDLLV